MSNKNYNIINKTILLIFISGGMFLQACAGGIDPSRFRDSAHHWYDIHDENRVIDPVEGQERYSPDQYEKIADNILLFQKNNGAWAKNYDMAAILRDEQIEKVKASKEDLNTTIDNGATHSQISYLAEAYTLSGKEKYKEAFLKGMDFLFESQYDNGGWPQHYPDTSSVGYFKYITFNDGAMIGVMRIMRDIVYKEPAYTFVPAEYYERAKSAFDRGIKCIIDMQIEEGGRKTVWCQQHDNVTLEPRPARTFEPACICNGESSEIVLFLMSLNSPDENVISSVKAAVVWFEEAAIAGRKLEVIESDTEEFIYHTANYDRIMVRDADAPPIWTRFTELGTHRPMFCRRDGQIVYTLSEVDKDRRTGYSWYNYDPQEVLKRFPDWLKKLN